MILYQDYHSFSELEYLVVLPRTHARMRARTHAHILTAVFHMNLDHPFALSSSPPLVPKQNLWHKFSRPDALPVT